MAGSTLANFPNPHQLFAEIPRLFARPRYPEPHLEFLVFPSSEAEYHWRITALSTNRTVSRHKSLVFALRKCTRLNERRGAARLDPLKGTLSGLPDANSCSACHKGIENGFEKKH